MRANVYVDGFNLYYGIRRWQGSRWLDLGALCTRLFPNDDIHRIRYFTARVKGKADPGSPIRQQAYLAALRTVPGLTIHFGTFLANETRMPLAFPSHWMAPVLKTEEKGSDVNLATHLLLDVFDHDCEMAVVFTNDSDLHVPIRVVQEPPASIPVWVINPHPVRSNRLKPTHHLDLHKADVVASQFPDVLQSRKGKEIRKPPRW